MTTQNGAEDSDVNMENETGVSEDAAEALKTSNLQSVATLHGAGALTALTLFGAGHVWAVNSEWLIAQIVAIGMAVIAGSAVHSIAHEWGHFAGARLSGSKCTVLEKPYKYFFMFNFDAEANDARQALWMSWGGLSGSWGLLLLLGFAIPMESWACVALLATLFGRALNASVFEVPVIMRTMKSRQFQKELETQLTSHGIQSVPGIVAGLFAFAALT